MQTVLDANLGSVEISCPWCVHKYPFWTDLIVDESKIPEMFYKVKAAYERILYLQNYSSERVGELTRLQRKLIRDKKILAAKSAATTSKGPKCPGFEAASNSFTSCCAGEDVCQCPA